MPRHINEKMIDAINETTTLISAYTEFMIAVDKNQFVRYFVEGWDAYYTSPISDKDEERNEYLKMDINNRMRIMEESGNHMAEHLWGKYFGYNYDYGRLWRNMDVRNRKIVLLATLFFFEDKLSLYRNTPIYGDVYKIIG